MDFTYCKLEDILSDIHSGGTPSTTEKQYWGGNIKWLSSGETGQRFISDTIDKITEDGVKNSSTKLAKKNNIVMACAGQGKTRGQTSFLLDDMYINQSVIVLEPNASVLPLYLFYNLSSRYDELRGGSDASSTRGSITTTALKKLSFRYPNLTIQTKIVDILFAYDDLIENNNKRIALLEKAAQELYKEWFVRFRFPGYEKAKFVNGIPEGWTVGKAGELCEIITGRKDANEATGGRYPFFTCARETTLSTDDFILNTNAILISGNGSYTGLVKKYSGKMDLYQRTYALHSFKNVQWLYLYWVFKINFERQFMGGSTGCAIPYITKPNIFNFKVIIPTEDLQLKAQAQFELIHTKTRILEVQNQNLIKQRDLLLPRLMSGKLEIDVESVNEEKETNKVISFELFKQEFKFAARADNALSDDDVKNLYEAYCNDKCKKE